MRPSATGNEWAFPPPDADTPWQTQTLREGGNDRTITTDLKTGLITLSITDDFGKVQDADHGLINGSIAREVWTIHPDDPLSARGSAHWSDEIERDDIRLRTETYGEMWSDQTTFYLSARLEAYENDRLIFEKDLSDSIPRKNL